MTDPKQLLREVVMRCHLMFPENPQDEIWFDEGIKNQHKLFADIVDSLDLGNVKTPASINTKRALEVLKHVTSHETIDLTKPSLDKDDMKAFSINDIKSCYTKDRSFIGAEWLIGKLRDKIQ